MSIYDERFVFSERAQRICDVMNERINPENVHWGTFTHLPDDKKTPFQDVFEKNPDSPYIINLAKGIVESWMVSEPVIFERDILVGFPRPDRIFRDEFSHGIISEKEKEEWDERALALWPRLCPLDDDYMHEEGERRMGKEAYWAATDEGLWWTGGYQGHTVPSYEKLLSMGIGGVVAQIDEYDRACSDPEKKDFYEACRIVMKGLSAWILMHADAADKKADETECERNAAELRAVAENCRRIAWDAPSDMYGACQLVWSYCLWDGVDSLGRTDYYMNRFYNGTPEEDDCLAALMMKFCENGVHDITVGGMNPDGSDSTNALSYLLLQILRTLHAIHPRMTVRINDNTPTDLVDLAVAMWSEGLSDPTIAGDNTVIGGLVGYGAKLEDARGYTVLGCQEIEIPGKSNFGCEDGSMNLAKVLEYTLNHGCDRFTGVKVGIDVGGTEDYDTFDKLWDAYERQIDYFLPIFVDLCNRGVDIRVANVSKLVKSPLTEACIERGRSLDDSGSIYNYGVVETAGHSAVADAFFAMKTLVYDENKISLSELEAALAADYEGYEEIRRMLLTQPKFGNNDEAADEMAHRVLEMFWRKIGKFKTRRGDVYTGACSLLTAGNAYGRSTWALPDGRHKGEPLGNSIGPRTGSDKNGLTAMLSSVAKMPLGLGVGGSTCNVMIPTTIMDTESNRASISALIRTFVKLGGQLAQVTTATLEEMRDAQIHPELHEDLIVRVGGFSAKFIYLMERTQNEIMSRYSN